MHSNPNVYLTCKHFEWGNVRRRVSTDNPINKYSPTWALHAYRFNQHISAVNSVLVGVFFPHSLSPLNPFFSWIFVINFCWFQWKINNTHTLTKLFAVKHLICSQSKRNTIFCILAIRNLCWGPVFIATMNVFVEIVLQTLTNFLAFFLQISMQCSWLHFIKFLEKPLILFSENSNSLCSVKFQLNHKKFIFFYYTDVNYTRNNHNPTIPKDF